MPIDLTIQKPSPPSVQFSYFLLRKKTKTSPSPHHSTHSFNAKQSKARNSVPGAPSRSTYASTTFFPFNVTEPQNPRDLHKTHHPHHHHHHHNNNTHATPTSTRNFSESVPFFSNCRHTVSQSSRNCLSFSIQREQEKNKTIYRPSAKLDRYVELIVSSTKRVARERMEVNQSIGSKLTKKNPAPIGKRREFGEWCV